MKNQIRATAVALCVLFQTQMLMAKRVMPVPTNDTN